MRVFPRLRLAVVTGSLSAGVLGFSTGMLHRPALCQEPLAAPAMMSMAGPGCRLIDGKAIAGQIRKEIKEGTSDLVRDYGVQPGLAVVLVGDRTDSSTYVRMKKRAADEVGFHSVDCKFSERVTQAELIECVQKLNADPKVRRQGGERMGAWRAGKRSRLAERRRPPRGERAHAGSDIRRRCPSRAASRAASSHAVPAARCQVHGILVQLPLPRHIDEAKVLEEIKVEKDVDGFSASNIGNMCLRGGKPPLALPCTPAGCVELLQRSNVEVCPNE